MQLLAILTLFIGATGLGGIYSQLLPSWIAYAISFLPWIIFFTVTFCNRPLLPSRPFRFCLIFIMCWYGLATITAEALNFFGLVAIPPNSPHAITFFRVLMHLGWFSFIPLILGCRVLRQHELNKAK
jgi:hypothetical protein